MCSLRKPFNLCKINSLITNYPTTVYDSLLGNAMTNKNLVVLENHCVIIRRDHRFMRGKVKIIAGGGAGTEPSEAYYVGKGMLTAAVVGDLFASPSASEILLAIRELAYDDPEGILLLVKNYIGDKLNFTVAMDQAVKENINVKMLIIEDDVFYQTPMKQGRQGMAGSVLVYKIAGEMAEQGKLLDEIIEECKEHVLCELATASVTLSTCSIINCNFLKKLMQHEEMILGLGIYGKGGSKKIKIPSLQEVVSLVLQEIISTFGSIPSLVQNNVTVLVNNLGATPKLEEAVIAKEVSLQLTALGFKIVKLYVGTFMSSSASHGFSVSLLKMNSPDIIKYLNAPTAAPGWPGFCVEEVFEPPGTELPITFPPISADDVFKYEELQAICVDSNVSVLSEKAVAAMKQITIFAAEALISCEKQLNLIDSETGDGDIGTTLRRGAEALKKAVVNDELNLRKPYKFLYEVSEICCKFMGGLSGILYCIFFKTAAKALHTSEKLSPELCCTAFKEAVKALQIYGDAELGERTMLDSLVPAAESFESALNSGRNIIEAVYLAAITCEYKAEETKCQNAGVLPFSKTNSFFAYPDAGAHAATIWLRAISEGLKLHYPIESFEAEAPSRGPGIFLWKFLNEEEASYVLLSELSSQELIQFFEKKLGSDDAIVMNLLIETVKFCSKKFKNCPRRTSVLVASVHYTHRYFLASKWRTPAEVYFYFRECILRQCVESPPISIEIFKPEEVRDVLVFFIENYLRNLPLIMISQQPHYKLQLNLKHGVVFSGRKDTITEQGKID